jgi:HEPN domain-containing protein
LIKAQHDLQAARALANQTSPLLDVAIYHCQQAAEKAIKGFLIFHDQRLEKTHNILVLVEQASKIVPEWSTKLDAAERLFQNGQLNWMQRKI